MQNVKTGEIITLSSTKPRYWFGEKRDYDLAEIRKNPHLWKKPDTSSWFKKYKLTPKQKATLKKKGVVQIIRSGKKVTVHPYNVA